MLATLLFATGAAADPAQLSAMNALRVDAGRGPLELSSQLAQAADAHARDMASKGYFSHQAPDGSGVGARVSATGYGWCVVAENIAKGQGSLDEVMAAWRDSPGHWANMISPDVRDFAIARGPDNIWVMVLAAPGC